MWTSRRRRSSRRCAWGTITEPLILPARRAGRGTAGTAVEGSPPARTIKQEEPPAARVADPGPVRFRAALLKRHPGLDPGLGFLHPFPSDRERIVAGERIKYSAPRILAEPCHHRPVNRHLPQKYTVSFWCRQIGNSTSTDVYKHVQALCNDRLATKLLINGVAVDESPSVQPFRGTSSKHWACA